MKIENVSGIPFDEEQGEEKVKWLRHPGRRPTNFAQNELTKHYKDLMSQEIKVLEVGCGWGRNAQFFILKKV